MRHKFEFRATMKYEDLGFFEGLQKFRVKSESLLCELSKLEFKSMCLKTIVKYMLKKNLRSV